MPSTKRGNKNAQPSIPSQNRPQLPYKTVSQAHVLAHPHPPLKGSLNPLLSSDPIVVCVGEARILKRIRRRRLGIPPPGRRHSPGVILGIIIKWIPSLLRPERVIVVAADRAGSTNLAAAPSAVWVRVVGARAAGAATTTIVRAIVMVVIVVVSHVDGRIRLLVVRRKRECGLVRVDVLATELGTVVTRQAVVPLVVFESPYAEECRDAEEEAARGSVSLGHSQRDLVQQTYKTKTPIATTALLMPQAVPHRSAELYAAWVAKAESQMTVKRASTATITRG